MQAQSGLIRTRGRQVDGVLAVNGGAERKVRHQAHPDRPLKVVAELAGGGKREQGFKTTQQTGIQIAPSDTRGVDFTLEIGTQGETSSCEATGVSRVTLR